MSNASLAQARISKKDEFYTSYADVEFELRHYDLRQKLVYLNCDDPEISNFWKYLHLNFGNLDLKGLWATGITKPYFYSYYGGRDHDVHYYLCDDLLDTDFRSEICVKLAKQSDIVITNPPFSLFRDYLEFLKHIDTDFIVLGNTNCITYHKFLELIFLDRIYPGVTFNKICDFVVPDDYQNGCIDD